MNRFCIISDTHFGDPESSLVQKVLGDYSTTEYFDRLINFLPKDIEYLILAGDIFDFSIASYDQVYEIASIFFSNLLNRVNIKEIIYIPGNHDFDFWVWTQLEVCLFNRLRQNKPPKKLNWNCPGVLTDSEFIMPKVNRQVDGGYGGLFLDNLTKGVKWNVVYPNLYILIGGYSVLVTHGHYFDPAWVLFGDLVKNIMDKDDLSLLVQLDPMCLYDLVSLNFPFSQLICSGIGQAGVFGHMVNKIQKSAKHDPNITQIRHYVLGLCKYLFKTISPSIRFNSIIEYALGVVGNKVSDLIARAYSKSDKVNKIDRLRIKDIIAYLNSCESEILEMSSIDSDRPIKIPRLNSLIFGHTHSPIRWGVNQPLIDFGKAQLKVGNTGGWLLSPTKKDVMAEVMICDNTYRLRSFPI